MPAALGSATLPFSRGDAPVAQPVRSSSASSNARWSAATSSSARHTAASWRPITSGSAAAISSARATARVAKSVRWTSPGGSPGLKIAVTAAGSPARPSGAESAR